MARHAGMITAAMKRILRKRPVSSPIPKNTNEPDAMPNNTLKISKGH